MNTAIFDHLYELNLRNEILFYTYLLQSNNDFVGSSYFSPTLSRSIKEIKTHVEAMFCVRQPTPFTQSENDSTFYFGGYKADTEELVTPVEYFEMIILVSERLSAQAREDFSSLCECFTILVEVPL